MKKRKLRLRRETLGRLDQNQLSQVAGGEDPTVGAGVCTANDCPTVTCDTCIGTCNPCDTGGSIPPTLVCSRPPTVCNTCFPTACQ